MITKGQKINDRYEIIKTIIKILRGDLSGDEKFVRRFQREALAASSLSHPNIVEMYDVGEDKGMYYIVMEYVKGVTLKQLIKKRGGLSLSECIDIMLQLTDGISHAHASYIIHRDIKPQNIMIQDNGEIKITDFGIAIALNNTQMTQTNSIMGSVHYLPPEQASGKVATVKSDIYSMGIMFYELLTGSLPFKGDTAFEIAFKQIKEDIPSVREINPSIPQSVENVVLKATAKNPKNRYNSAKEMHDDLLTVLDENRENEQRIGFKYVEHDGNITKDDLIIDENDERKNGIKLQEDPYEPEHKTNVILWVLSGIFTVIIIALIILFFVSPSVNKVPDVKIPDVSNMTVIEAEQVLKKEGFEVANDVVQVGDDTIEKGYVVKTSPSIGRTVKKGTEITLYESKGPERYTIEDYTGKNYIEVKTILENNHGLNVVVEKMEVDDKKEYDENLIISQDLKVGTEVSKGANITLYIPDIVVKYPDFTDGTWTKSDIESFCKKYGIDVEFKYDAKAGYSEGAIISQSRPKDMPVVKGVSIEIHVATKYTAPETNTDNNENNN